MGVCVTFRPFEKKDAVVYKYRIKVYVAIALIEGEKSAATVIQPAWVGLKIYRTTQKHIRAKAQLG